jgi:flavin-dependent thymidylate synthase
MAVMTEQTTDDTISVLDHGFVALDGALASDLAVVNAARVSFNVRSEEMSERDEGLIRFLMRDRHGSPFEHGYFRFIVKAPIFVVREHHRHRAGHCLPGDTEVWCETIASSGRTVRKRPIAELWRNWNVGVPDSLGRTRALPSCRSFTMRVWNNEEQTFDLGTPRDIYRSGTKSILELGVGEPKLRCSEDHRILTNEGWAKAGDLGRSDAVAISGTGYHRGETIPPALRRGIGVWTSMQRELLVKEVDACYSCGVTRTRDQLHLDHVVPVVVELARALDRTNLKPMCESCHRAKTNAEQSHARRLGCYVSPNFVRLPRKPIRVSEEETYDIEMHAPHHNFVANRVVVHNSYNEWSGRYSKLEAEYYVPDYVRTQVGKPGAYSFEPVEPEVAEATREELRAVAEQAFDAYERMLEQGVAKEVARMALPLSLYTKYFWSCNPRSLMHFCSLRNSEQAQFEIREYARAAEAFLERLMPITHAAFVAGGRVAP